MRIRSQGSPEPATTPERSASGPVLSVGNLSKTYPGGRIPAVDDVSFDVADGAFYTLLGPSGCGKTTTLRCVAGLERPDSGHIQVEGRTVAEAGQGRFVPPHKRDIGMVFQSYGVWPHMTVFDNVAFPLKVKRLPKGEVRSRVTEALASVQLEDYAKRNATQLSGGQQQRLALARALVRRPKLLLLDEPLSNLDAKLRETMRAELRRVQRELGVTTLYVTHDQTEALTMSDCVAVMAGGHVVQEGTPTEIYSRPGSRFVAGFLGASNFLDGAVLTSDSVTATVSTVLGPVTGSAFGHFRSGAQACVCVRPEDLGVGDESAESANSFRGQVEAIVFYGTHFRCEVGIRDTRLTSVLPPDTKLRPGDHVSVAMPVDRCIVLGDDAQPPAAGNVADRHDTEESSREQEGSEVSEQAAAARHE